MPNVTTAKIKAASLLAQKAMRSLDAETIQQLMDMYQEAADLISDDIQERGDRVQLGDLPVLLKDITEKLADLGKRRDALLSSSVKKAAGLGVKPLAGSISDSILFSINHEAVRFVHEFKAADGLQLSDRLWRLDRGAKTALIDHIQGAVIRGQSAHQAARDFLARGEDVPEVTKMMIKAGQPAEIAKGARDLMTGKGKASYNAERVFRTEMNRAHGEAYISASLHHPDAAGVRFILSPAHPKKDICDTHANADLYGLGAGVYPNRASCPWPAHPNTLSFVEIVFKDEIDQEESVIPNSGRSPVAKPTANEIGKFGLDELLQMGNRQAERLLDLAKSTGDSWYLNFPSLILEDLNRVRSTGLAAVLQSGGEGARLVKEASKLFPDDWTRHADNYGRLFAKKIDNRAYHITLGKSFAPRRLKLENFGVIDALPGDGFLTARNLKSATHEYTHRLQHAIPELDDVFQSLHVRRTLGNPIKRLKDLFPGYRYGASEVAQEDHYVNAYQGKIYNFVGSYTGKVGALEVMTMSFERLCDPLALHELIQGDREMFDLMIGALYHYAP